MATRIVEVESHSYAEVNKLKAGDILITVNGEQINNKLDLDFFSYTAKVEIVVNRSGKELAFNIQKNRPEEALGIVIEEHECTQCVNNCIFCFVDQMPPSMRDTLYIKDDDYYLSFLYGNYITLTNLSDAMIEKIIRMKISPLYISVHTTNPILRQSMMRYKHDFDILKRLKRLAEGGIEYHTQLVLVPGYNNGEELISSLEDLTSDELNVVGIGVVPVGMTKFRKELTQLPLFTQSEAREVIKIVDSFKPKFPYLYASDEFYVQADIPVPDADYYEDFAELENGIGMVRTMLDNYHDYKSDLIDFIKDEVKHDLVIVTGVSAIKYINMLAKDLSKSITPYKIRVLPVVNKYMGESVTVTGLLTFTDIKEQLELGLNEVAVFSNYLFNYENQTLDNYSKDDISNFYKGRIMMLDLMNGEWDYEI